MIREGVDYRVEGRQALPRSGAMLVCTDLVTGSTFCVELERGMDMADPVAIEERLLACRERFKVSSSK